MIEAVPGLPAVSDVDADAALAALYQAHFRPLVRLAVLLLDDVGAAEEVVQDAYVGVYRGWHRVRDPERALPYLRRAVVNGARSRLRRRLVARRHEPEPPPPVRSAEDDAMDAATREAVLAGIRLLPRRQREAIVLRYYAELTESQIAAAMGVGTGSVKTHLARGTAALAAHLGATR